MPVNLNKCKPQMLSTNHHNGETLLHIWGIEKKPKESCALVVGTSKLYSKTTINPPIKKKKTTNLVNDAMTKLYSRIKSNTVKGREKAPDTHQHIDFIFSV